MTSDLFPMLTSPVTEWQAYVEAHPPHHLNFCLGCDEDARHEASA